MEMVPPPPGLPGSRSTSHDYVIAIDLLGQVIARHGARIATERSRCHQDQAAIAQLVADRAAAVRAAAELTSADPDRLHETLDRYRQTRDVPPHRVGRLSSTPDT
jgi:hypothetical protein